MSQIPTNSVPFYYYYFRLAGAMLSFDSLYKIIITKLISEMIRELDLYPWIGQ